MVIFVSYQQRREEDNIESFRSTARLITATFTTNPSLLR
jgi:hypothetical protein